MPQLHSHPRPLLPPPTSHSVKGTGLILPTRCPLGRAHGEETLALGLAGVQWQEGRGPQQLVGKPRTHADPCPQVSPPPSLRPCSPQWLWPMAARTGLLCWGRPSSVIRVWQRWQLPEPWLPSGHGHSGWAGAGAAPLGLVALGSEDAVRHWEAWWTPTPLPTPPLGVVGGCILLCRWPWGQCDLTDTASAWGEPMRGWDPREECWLPAARALPGHKGWREHGAGTVCVPLPGGPTCGHWLHECRAMSPCPVRLLLRH